MKKMLYMHPKFVLMLMGKSGCGKSTLESSLCQHPEFRKVVSVTTRPRREDEVDGQDYTFLSPHQFLELKLGGHLIQYTKFAGNEYGSIRSEYTTSHPFVTLVVVPYSAATFTPVLRGLFDGIGIFNIYFNISDGRLRENMRTRGDTDDMIDKRLASDDLEKQFEQNGLRADFTITDDTLDKLTTKRVLSWLQYKTGALYNG